MVCRVSNLTLNKKSGLPSIFPKYTQQRIIVCRVFLGITLGKHVFQRKKNSQHTIIVCRVFLEITLGKPIFQRKKIIFFSANFSLIAAIQNTLSTTYLHAHQRGAVVLAGDEPAGPPREARTATSGRAAAQRRPLQHHRGQHRGPHHPNAATLDSRRRRHHHRCS